MQMRRWENGFWLPTITQTQKEEKIAKFSLEWQKHHLKKCDCSTLGFTIIQRGSKAIGVYNLALQPRKLEMPDPLNTRGRVAVQPPTLTELRAPPNQDQTWNITRRFSDISLESVEVIREPTNTPENFWFCHKCLCFWGLDVTPYAQEFMWHVSRRREERVC